MSEIEQEAGGVSRRDFLRFAGAAAAVVGLSGSDTLETIGNHLDFYQNVIRDPGQDPSAINVRGMLYATQMVMGNVVLLRAPDVPDLRDAEVVATWRPSGDDIGEGTGVWAPKVSHYNGRFTIDAADAYRDVNAYQNSFTLQLNEDGELVFDRYMQNSGQNWRIDRSRGTIHGQRYSVWSQKDRRKGNLEPTGNIDTQYLCIGPEDEHGDVDQYVVLSKPEFNWEKGPFANINESGRLITTENGRTMLLYSGGASWDGSSSAGMLILRKDGDPMKVTDWIKLEIPLMTSAGGIVGVGAQELVKSNEQWWQLYVSGAPSNKRKLRAQYARFDDEGILLGSPPRHQFKDLAA